VWDLLSTWLLRAQLYSWGAEVGKDLRVCGRVRLELDGKLRIGNSVRINSGPANLVGGDRRMAIWVGRNGHCEIYDRCGLSNSTIVCYHRIEILDDTYIGGGCEIYDTDFHQIGVEERLTGSAPVPAGPVRIGPRAFIGGWSILLKNVTIGEGAVVGAGSVVTKSIPPREVWAGRPARFIRRL
jgi:acetyltransferase-like isoleucine patch superfamily enzyme